MSIFLSINPVGIIINKWITQMVIVTKGILKKKLFAIITEKIIKQLYY
ncbi:hypothetical protein [Caldifermentibacillus hisashii]|uniref:Uncharacterized protein n=1 Tax=Caldibacillus thermoamylovorans TaxID=35841 RepID=A0ABD4AAA8_9BACI|nr:hypothetical protein B4064_3075 [Caldibacillus thermoamylovorans]KIO69931.1 hypothetical protein B4166_0296 [Caldibacillus thermoamylovorans]KIO73735.1 hypothetical protein B4167_0306 [Caldibacillus thermoamylovorans]